ncbi:MAG: type II toxin-antitoxin system death-on-curing family toxin [Patescibacteria group bacterium]|nr:type II toxin-antitoxin system death-on-curing family toxin [Patescibacteria group bacterium]MDE2590156.1 type II toxin-antitoxin system death-on-curing family toxin [Patescibacteria group bacterium]
MIKRFGGSFGIRELSLIESAIGRPQSTFDGQDLYESIFHKAAAVLQSLLKNHPFVDGNKRTALTSAGLFLEINGYKLLNFHKEEEDLAINVDNEHLTIEEIAKWLQVHSQEEA